MIDDLIACDSCWSIQGYSIFPFISWAGLYVAVMYGWVFKWAFFEVLFPYNDQGRNSTASALLFGIKNDQESNKFCMILSLQV